MRKFRIGFGITDEYGSGGIELAFYLGRYLLILNMFNFAYVKYKYKFCYPLWYKPDALDFAYDEGYLNPVFFLGTEFFYGEKPEEL